MSTTEARVDSLCLSYRPDETLPKRSGPWVEMHLCSAGEGPSGNVHLRYASIRLPPDHPLALVSIGSLVRISLEVMS